MAFHRLKRAFTAGEISRIMSARVELPRYISGCKTLRNAYALAQGPAVRRMGTKFIIDLSAIVSDMGAITGIDMIPFVFSETQAYQLIYVTDGAVLRIYFAYKEGLIEDPVSPGNPYYVETPKLFIPRVFDYAQWGDTLIMTQRDQAPAELIRNDHDDWTFQDITFTDQPTDWTAGDYPGKVSFFEQRSVFASTISRPQTVWFSKAGEIYDFSVSAPLVEADAVTFTIASGEQNKIAWLNSSRQLLIGTIGDEWAMSGGGQPLSYLSIRSTRQTNIGGENIAPVMAGASTLFVERMGRRMYDFSYNFNADSYLASDTSILAPHLTENSSLIDLTYARIPNSIIWAIRADGSLIGLTFQQEHNIAGWHRHDTDGGFTAVSSIPDEDIRQSETWVIVKRNIQDVDKYYLEKFMPEFKEESTYDAWFVDSGIDYNDPENPIQTLGGLDHLEGKTVHILTDGAVHAPQVVTGGQISLYKAYGRIILGLPYQTDIEPYPLDVQSELGTTLGRNQRATNVVVYLHKSLGFKIGYDENNLEEQPFRKPSDPTGQAVPLFSGFKEVSFPEGYHKESNILIRQEQPLPLTVLATVDEFEVYDR